jgi:hypothetical protein
MKKQKFFAGTLVVASGMILAFSYSARFTPRFASSELVGFLCLLVGLLFSTIGFFLFNNIFEKSKLAKCKIRMALSALAVFGGVSFFVFRWILAPLFHLQIF